MSSPVSSTSFSAKYKTKSSSENGVFKGSSSSSSSSSSIASSITANDASKFFDNSLASATGATLLNVIGEYAQNRDFPTFVETDRSKTKADGSTELILTIDSTGLKTFQRLAIKSLLADFKQQLLLTHTNLSNHENLFLSELEKINNFEGFLTPIFEHGCSHTSTLSRTFMEFIIPRLPSKIFNVRQKICQNQNYSILDFSFHCLRSFRSNDQDFDFFKLALPRSSLNSIEVCIAEMRFKTTRGKDQTKAMALLREASEKITKVQKLSSRQYLTLEEAERDLAQQEQAKEASSCIIS